MEILEPVQNAASRYYGLRPSVGYIRLVPKEGKGKERIVTPNGETVSAEIVQPGTQDATGVGYISHFATCPVANMFRRK